jgi:hypothetical protein
MVKVAVVSVKVQDQDQRPERLTLRILDGP